MGSKAMRPLNNGVVSHGSYSTPVPPMQRLGDGTWTQISKKDNTIYSVYYPIYQTIPLMSIFYNNFANKFIILPNMRPWTGEC